MKTKKTAWVILILILLGVIILSVNLHSLSVENRDLTIRLRHQDSIINTSIELWRQDRAREDSIIRYVDASLELFYGIEDPTALQFINIANTLQEN